MADVFDRLKAALSDRYVVDREVGSGGMATVYLAQDIRHDREVAIKVLRPDLAAALGPERFLQEIKIAAQLQHPNILPLHDSGEVDGFLFYVMPYVEGHSLRDKLAKEGELPIPEAVRILRDIVDAMTEAHALGVVHRDIKPENVLLRGRHALVTDFGVAKAVSEATGRAKLTTAGVALGTPAYMAPEQASADPHLDQRVDIYAIGAVAYELLTGRPVFMGTTPQMVLSAHMTEQPEHVTKHRQSVPPALESVVMRCLEKRPADRWQSAEELLPHLEALATPSGGMTPTDTLPMPVPQRRKRWVLPAVFGTVMAVIVTVIGVIQMIGSGSIVVMTSNALAVASEPTSEFYPALSPDGSQVAYVRFDSTFHLHMRSTTDVAGGAELLLFESSSSMFFPSWTIDGERLRFYACEEGCSWREVGRLGGAVRSLDVTREWRCAWAPNENQIACPLGDGVDLHQTAGGGSERLAFADSVIGMHSLAWSPDGSRIAYVAGGASWVTTRNVTLSSIWVVNVDGGEPARVTAEEYLDTSPTWLDEDHLLFVSNRDGQREVYVTELGSNGPRGEPVKVPGPIGPHTIDYSVAGSKLAYSRLEDRKHIWSYSLSDGWPISIGDGQAVTTGDQLIENHDVSADGLWIAYDSDIGGNPDIYVRRFDGGETVRLTDVPGGDFRPHWSPDGSEIAYSGQHGGGRSELWVISAGGGNPVPLSGNIPGDFHLRPTWSPTGLEIAFSSTYTGRAEVWLITRDSVGGTWHSARQITDTGCVLDDWASDGSGILCRTGSVLMLYSRDGDVLASRNVSDAGLTPRWQSKFSADGSLVYCLARQDDGKDGIWAIPLPDGAAELVIAYDGTARFPDYRFSVGREHIYVTVGEYEMDIWVMDVEVER